MRVLIALSMLLMCACDAFTSVESRLGTAQRETEAGDYGKALVELRNVLESAPANGRALLLLARLGVQTGDLDGADSALRRAGQAGVSAAELAPLQLRVLLDRGRFDVALDAIDKGEMSMSGTRQLYRARALQGMRRADEALAAFNALFNDADAGVGARIGSSEILFSRGERDQALAVLQAAVKQDSQSPEALLALGMLQSRVGRTEDAAKSWRAALPLAPGRLTVLQHLGILGELAQQALDRGDVQAAELVLRDMVKVSPQGPQTRMLDATLAIAHGKADVATQQLQELTTQLPGLAHARMLLASALLAQGNLEQAIQQIEALDAQRPGDVGTRSAIQLARAAAAASMSDSASAARRWLAIAATQIALGQQVAAELSLLQAQKADPASLGAASALAAMDLRFGRFQQALDRASALRRRYPQEPAVAILQGDAHAALGQYADADKFYGEAWVLKPGTALAIAMHRNRARAGLAQPTEPLRRWLGLHPADTVVRAALAEALMTSGDTAQAVREYERLLAASPRDIVTLNNLATLYTMRGDPRAVEMAKRAYDLAGRSAHVADTYGWALVKAGKVAAGLDLLEQAAAAGGNPTIAYHRAAALMLAGRTTEGLAALRQLLAGQDRFPERAEAEKLLAGR